MAHPFKIDRILLATDFSPACEPAQRCATVLANRFNAEMYLLHVVPDAKEPGRGTDTAERQPMEAMRRLREELVAAHDKHTTAILSGDPAVRILQKAEDVQADLIVMGTPARCPRPGGLTDTVVRGPSCPVLAVPHARHDNTEVQT
jgi:nucleotide-binding universal stress UspA family protein